MAAEGGVFYEAYKYSLNFKLPLNFVIEDNNLSTNTPTSKVWGRKILIIKNLKRHSIINTKANILIMVQENG